MPKLSLVTGRIHLPEVSGIESLPGDRLILVSDEHRLRTAENATEQLLSGRVQASADHWLDDETEAALALEDAEDVCWDGERYLYVTCSHGRNRSGEAEVTRARLARFELDPDGRPVECLRSGGLYWGIQTMLPQLALAALDTPARNGLNIEGVAWSGKHLVFGLRSPTITRHEKRRNKMQEDAIILRVTNPGELFEEPDAPAEFKADKHGDRMRLLNLDGHGIRGLCRDRDLGGYWIISGLAADPNHPVRNVWALWRWTKKRKLRRVELPGTDALERPEAICRIVIKDEPCLLIAEDQQVKDHLVSDDDTIDPRQLADAGEGCDYLLVPLRMLDFD